MTRSLRAFIDELDRAGELRRFSEPVSPELQIAALADREARRPAPSLSASAADFDPARADLGGEALLFENVEGCDLPLAINVFGSYRRMEMALGSAFPAIAARIGSLVQPQLPRSLGEGLGLLREFGPLLKIGPRTVRRGLCQEVVQQTALGEVDLTRLPLIKCWPLDGDPRAVGINLSPEDSGTAGGGGRYITFAGMHTIHADDAGVAKPASHNIGMYRAQLIDATHLAMHWHVHHDGAAHWRSWKARGERMPIAICFGGESVLPYAATAPLPPGISELLMAGFLNGRGIPMVAAKTVPLRVPANCEVVIEGWVSTEAGHIGWDPAGDEPLGPGAVFEGPFGDHTGYYSMPDRYPIVEVTAITRRSDAIFPATVVGLPPQEDYYLGKATERLFLPLLQTLVPDIEDYHLPRFGCFHNCAFIQIDKQYPMQARRVMHAIWGAGQMAWTKLVVVVDSSINVHDEEAVLRAIMQRCCFDRDLELANGPVDILDHAASRLGASGKLGIDATGAWPGEEVGGIAADVRPSPVDATAIIASLKPLTGWKSIARVTVPDWAGGRAVVLAVDKNIPGDGLRAIEAARELKLAGLDLVIATDADVDGEDYESTWFHLCASVDPARDLHRVGSFLGIDATQKIPGDERNGLPVRPWPPKVTHAVRHPRAGGDPE